MVSVYYGLRSIALKSIAADELNPPAVIFLMDLKKRLYKILTRLDIWHVILFKNFVFFLCKFILRRCGQH